MESQAESMYLTQLASSINNSDRGQRGSLVSNAAKRLGCSVQTVYNRLKKYGVQSSRKLRSDKGDSKVSLDAVMHVSAIMHGGKRALGKEMLPMGDTISVLRSNGILDVDVSPSTMFRLMRKNDCHPEQMARPDAHVSMKSLYPNHVWQLDASICVLYRIKDGRVGVLDARKFNERKPKDLAKIINERVMRYAVTDHTSGSVFCRFYNAAGEDQFTLFEFLMEAFHKRDDGMMYGVPHMLVWDAGSANMAHTIRGLLTNLIVKHWAHKPGNPRAKGQVECVHNIIERKFEGRLSMIRIDNVEQLNAHMDSWLKKFNGVDIHSRHGHARWGVWQMIKQDQLRLCPPKEVCSQLMFAKPETRIVIGNLRIQFTCKGFPPAQYDVSKIDCVRVGDKVSITVNPYRLPNIFVIAETKDGEIKYHECEPVAKDVFGFAVDSPVFGERYQSPADSDVDDMRKQVNTLAYGERDTLDAQNVKAKGRLMFNGAIDPFKDVREAETKVPAYMPRRGSDIDVPLPAQIELRPLSHVEASLEMVARLGRALEGIEAKSLRTWYPDGVPETELDTLQLRLENIHEPEPLAEEKPRLFAVK